MRRLNFVELLAWTVGAALIAIWVAYKVHASWGSRADIRKFEQAKAALKGTDSATPPPPKAIDLEPTHQQQKTLTATVQVDYSLWADGRIKEYEESLHADLEAPQALFRIQKLNLEVAVLEGTSDLVLNRGVGRIEGTAQIGEVGNIGIAGHRDGFFRGLKDIETGDTMELETLTGTQRFEIDKISIVSPEDVYVLAPTEDSRITLVTCYPFYFVGKAPLRYIVHAREIGSDQKAIQAESNSPP